MREKINELTKVIKTKDSTIKLIIQDKTHLKECWREERIDENTGERYYLTIREVKKNVFEIIKHYPTYTTTEIEYL
jgi:hypothetical protein